MKLRYEHLTLGQLGEVFGTTSHQVGRWLTNIGLRYESKAGKRPSRDAYSGGFVKDVPSKGQGYIWAWHAEKTVEALENAGHKVAIQPGHELLAPCSLNGPFVCRPSHQFGHEVVNGDGTVAVCVTGEENARFLIRLLNLADKHGVVRRLLGDKANDACVAVAGAGGNRGDLVSKKRTEGGRKTAPTHVYSPDTFDPIVHLPVELQQYADCARYFLHRIIWDRVQRRLTLDEFVPIKFDYLRVVIPDRVIKPLKLALQDSEVVECDNHFVEGEKSLGYSLRSPHNKSRIIRVALSDDQTADKVRANRQAQFKRVRLDVHKYLLSHYRRLEIDLPFALDLLKADPNFEVNKIPPQQISAKDWSFAVCRYGRLHTDLTQCPKEVRPALRVNGQPIVEIDVANSQPLFLALLLINYRMNGNKTFSYVTFPEKRSNPYAMVDEIITRTIHHFPQKEEDSTTPPPTSSITTRKEGVEMTKLKENTALMTNNKESSGIKHYQQLLRPDEIEFVRLCEQGALYESFMTRLELPMRKWVKEEFFSVIYGKNQFQSDLKSDFIEIFPHVAEVVKAHKRKDHGFLPRLMQNIEANFIINTVCRRLMNELPDAPVLTLHDCLLTTPSYVEAVSGVLRDEFARLGLSPKLHIKNHSLLC